MAAIKGLVSLVIPTYNVARYIRHFLASLEQQTIDFADLDIVFVDDGSTDESGEILKEWIHTTAPTARIISQPNGGLSSARNTGLKCATNRWVNFCDPDDTVPADYFEIVGRFLASDEAERVHLVATNLQILDDATGQIRDDHPLRFKFADGDRVVDLERHPRYIHLQAASAFYRRDLIEAERLQFDHLVQPNFEDGYFTTLYLAAQERPRLALLADAHYHYRHRDDGSSLVQASWSSADKYTQVTRHGYLRLLELVSDRRGRQVPIWVQNLVLYDLLWYFKQDERVHSVIGAVPRDVTSEFHHIVRQIMEYIDTETIEDYRLTPMSAAVRHALMIGAKGEQQRPNVVHIVQVDADKQIAEVRYFYGGELPREQFRVDGYRVEPVHAKIRSITYLGERMASERIAWLPATGTLEVALDGRRKPLALRPSRPRRYSVPAADMWANLAGQDAPLVDGHEPPAASSEQRSWTSAYVPQPIRAVKRRLKVRTRLRRVAARFARPPAELGERSFWATRRHFLDWLTRQGASTGPAWRRYGDAWVFTDRDNMAQDNAEHLYRHVRTVHPEVNAWFVIDRDSHDWERLAKDGFRLVSYGTREHVLLMLNCRHLISSQIDHYVIRPLDAVRFGVPRWRYTFLQHGVTKDDLSRWVNGKPISLFVTATRPEFASIAGDHTPYVFTTKETRLTGFPRHDRLWRLAQETPHEARRLILVMPTWRRALLGDLVSGGNDRLPLPGFWETEYAKQWTSVVESERLATLAADAGLQITFVPHPNMNSYLDERSFPAHVQVSRYRDVDIQQILASGALMLTDYSSNAFEMAYIQRPVVYFQFDRSSFFAGGHVYRQGTWSYDDDGFGPVAFTATSTIDEVEQLVSHGLMPQSPFAERMEREFPFRDGQSCERVYQAIDAITQPLLEEEYRRLDA